MAVAAKICGINAPEAMDAAIAGGAAYVGLVFYGPSPRYVTPDTAAALASRVSGGVKKVGLFVDASDADFDATVGPAGLDMLQLHGSEPPDRVAALKATYGLPVMKAVKVAAAVDLAIANTYIEAADWLLFDAKPPKSMPDALPGGNALSFDWELLADRDWPLPWMLSGGLDDGNVAEAVQISGAAAVDVSSGVETAPGVKSPERISAFLDAVKHL